ncbi:MAG: hypothetical protein Q9201_005730 [Fulgogasparrea decipioides]
MDAPINLLNYLKSKTQVDVDSLDNEVSTELGPFVDCTSNQMDAYHELLKPNHAALIKKSAALAGEIGREYPEVTREELAFEISMVRLAQTIVPNITGAILVMVNPLYSYSTRKIVYNGQRLYRLCKYLQPDFDMTRMIVKVPSTWEGLQACRELKGLGVKTLGTTVFTLEQAVLAAEAGCIYVSPFLNELKATMDPTPIFGVCTDIQRYYEQHCHTTRVKACAAVSVEQILQLAGVAAFTATADQLRELSSMKEPAADVMARSVFLGSATREHANGNANGHVNGDTNGHTNGDYNMKLEKLSFVDDESKYRLAFAKSDGGKGQLKTSQALNMFCEYQIKGEAMMKDADMTVIG